MYLAAFSASRALLNAIGAASSIGYPKMPVEMAGNAIDVSCNSSATRIDSRWQLASFSASLRWPPAQTGSHGVYDVARRQSACCRSHGLPLGKRPLLRDNPAAMLLDLRSASGVDRAVNAATAHQRRIGGVHDGIDLFARDVGWTGDDQQRPSRSQCAAGWG